MTPSEDMGLGAVYQEDRIMIFRNRVDFLITPTQFDLKIMASDTKPKVQGIAILLPSGSVVTITDFQGGNKNQTIKILGDGTTTIANNASIKTNTGANKLLAANKVYRFTFINSIWYEDA